jgi:hypothetical protein
VSSRFCQKVEFVAALNRSDFPRREFRGVLANATTTVVLILPAKFGRTLPSCNLKRRIHYMSGTQPFRGRKRGVNSESARRGLCRVDIRSKKSEYSDKVVDLRASRGRGGHEGSTTP